MSAVSAYKFHGSQIQVLVGVTADSPVSAITAITQANPAVVTDAGHTLADGDVIEISGVVGMTELNGGRYIVEVVDANSFQLLGVNSTGYGAWTSGGTYSIGDFSDFCDLTNYNRTGGTSPEIPTTALCSTAQEYLLGLPDFGTTAIDYNFAPATAVQQAIQAAYVSGDLIAVKVTLPDSGGTMVQMGFVQQTSETAGVGNIWTGSMTIRNTGNREDFFV
jgi:Ubiquitin-activating enzyme E1 FCCH domain/Lambda phage tail tube protein, TTP